MALEERRHPEAERLAEYADGVLDAESRAEVDQHLADCSDCRAVVMETMAFLEGQPATPAMATPRVVPFRPRRWVRGVTVGLAAAATLVLAVRVVRPEWVSGLFGPRADLPELQELIAFRIGNDNDLATSANKFINPEVFEVTTIRNIDEIVSLVGDTKQLA